MSEEQSNLPAVPATPMEMIGYALAQNATPETLERLLALQERYERNQARKAYAQAIVKARKEIGPIFKSAQVRMGAGRPAYSHETLDDIDRAAVPALGKYDLSYRWNTKVPDNKPDWVIVTCHVEHKDGHYEENSLGGPADTSGAKNPLQAIGSALTYLCRYTLKAALGLSATSDTDAAEPEELVTEMEVAQLRRKILDAKQTEERFCGAWKITKIEDLPRASFERAISSRELNPQQQK
jgi:ERF superfamily